MALQSAMAPAPLEKFATEEEASDEDRFSLRLSEGEDEEAGGVYNFIILFRVAKSHVHTII